MGLPRQELLLRWEEGICTSVPSGFGNYLQIRKRCCFYGNQTYYRGLRAVAILWGCWEKNKTFSFLSRGTSTPTASQRSRMQIYQIETHICASPGSGKLVVLGFPGRFKRFDWVGWLENSPTLSWPSSEVVEQKLACFLYFPKSWWKQIFSGTSELLFKFVF